MRGEGAFNELRALGGLPVAQMNRLERRVSDVLRHRYGARANLRAAVRTLITSLKALGVDRTRAMTLMRLVIASQSDTDEVNRPSVVDGRQPSKVLHAQVTLWIEEAWAVVRPAAADTES